MSELALAIPKNKEIYLTALRGFFDEFSIDTTEMDLDNCPNVESLIEVNDYCHNLLSLVGSTIRAFSNTLLKPTASNLTVSKTPSDVLSVFIKQYGRTILEKIIYRAKRELTASFLLGEDVNITISDDLQCLSLEMAVNKQSDMFSTILDWFISSVVFSMLKEVPLPEDHRLQEFKRTSCETIAKIITAHLNPNPEFPYFYNVSCGIVFESHKHPTLSTIMETTEVLKITIQPLIEGSVPTLAFGFPINDLLSRTKAFVQ